MSTGVRTARGQFGEAGEQGQELSLKETSQGRGGWGQHATSGHTSQVLESKEIRDTFHSLKKNKRL